MLAGCPPCELAVCVCLQANPVWNLLKKDAQKLNVNVSHRQPHCDLETSQKNYLGKLAMKLVWDIFALN